MDHTKKAFSNIIYLFLDFAFTSIFSLLFWIVMGKTLLPDQYGIIVTTVNFIAILSSVSLLGLINTVQKLIPEYTQKKQFKKINSLIVFSGKIILVSNILISVFLFIFASNISSYLNIPTGALLVGILILFSLSISLYFGSILYGLQQMSKYFLTDAVGFSVKLVVAIALVIFGYKYFGALVSVVICFAVITVFRIDFKFFKGAASNLEKKRVIFEYAFSAFISVLALTLFSNFPTIVLSSMKGVFATGIFGLASIITLPIFSIPNVLSSGLFPITSQLSVNKNNKKQQTSLIAMIFRYSLVICLPLILLFSFFSKALILLFSQSSYLGASNLFLPLSFGALLFGIGGILSSSIYAIKQPKLQRKVFVASTIFFVIVSVLLTFYFSSVGLSIAYLLSGLFYATLGFYYLKKHLSLELPVRDIGKLIISLTVLLVFLEAADILETTLFIKIVIATIGVLVYLLVTLYLRFFRKMDVQILDFISEKVPKTRFLINPISKIVLKYVTED